MTINGNHSMVASQELVQGAPSGYSTRIISSWQYRNVQLLADNLESPEYKKLAMDHNDDNAFRESLMFME